MEKKRFHIRWFEYKQLDRVTNFSSRTEIIKNIAKQGIDIKYYCSFSSKKEYYGLKNNIKYLGIFKNKYLKHIEFNILCVLLPLFIVIFSNNTVIISNQQLVKNMLFARFINKLIRKNNKFVLDVRTLPTTPETFDHDMIIYSKQVEVATKRFDGLSFITPFLEKTTMKSYANKLPTVIWSSGVDVNMFDANNYDYKRDNNSFRVFYHGGISLSRGNLNLIKACEMVVSKGYDIELIQIGKIVDCSISEYIKENKLHSWCKLYQAKPIAEIPGLIAKCDLPVLPFPDFMAWRVSSPIKLMEYMAMGKPVLAPNMECFTDVLQENTMVYYYDISAKNQIEEIASAIIERLESRDLSDYYIKNVKCIEYVSAHFTWEKQSEKLLHFCEAICQ